MSIKKTAHNAFWNIGGQLLPIAAAVAAVPLLVRAIGVDRFGFLSLAWALIGYAGLFDLGISRALTRVVAERLALGDRDGAIHVARVGAMLMGAFGILAGILLALGAPWLVFKWLNVPAALQQESVNALRLLAISIPVVLLMAAYRGVLDACHAFKEANIVRMVMGLLTYVGPLLATVWSPRLEWVVGAVVFMRMASTWWHAVLCWRIFAPLPLGGGIDRPTVKELMSLGGWISVSNIVSPLMAQLDRVILGGLVSVKLLAFYATPFDMITRALLLPYAFMAVLFPVMAGFSKSPAQAQETYSGSIRLLFVSMLPVSFSAMVLGGPLLNLWLGPEFAEHGTVVLQVLALGVLANTLAQAPANLIQGAGNPKWMAITHVLELPLFLMCLYGLTQAYGINGTAWSWTLRMILDAGLLFALAQWRLLPAGQGMLRWLLAGSGTAVLLVIACIPQSGAMAIVTWLVGLMACALLAWFVVLTGSDKRHLFDLLNARADSRAVV